jgi:hypothetical protein
VTYYYFTAVALNYIVQEYENCDCPDKEDNSEEYNNQITKKWANYTYIFAIIAIPSLITTILAVSWIVLAKKIEIPVYEELLTL